ncbi:hypothetical protein [Methylocapsa sp. S129]|uniref:hypothetical protein n=1 Tax=Methylocapsa sp. S129 TaxID=1641869 RepID=UPI00131E1FA4|nr:hypothetical protein [Methylocapsa sp. S129]
MTKRCLLTVAAAPAAVCIQLPPAKPRPRTAPGRQQGNRLSRLRRADQRLP